MKIVFFGDSLTQGTFGVSYVDRVAAGLRGHRFINEGVNGDTSFNLLKRLSEDVLALQPDVVFLMVGVNDAITHAQPQHRTYYRLAKGVPRGHISPIAFRENMRVLIGKLNVAGIKVLVALPPIEVNAETMRVMREMNKSLIEVCRELNAPYLDLFARIAPTDVPARPNPNTITTMQNNLYRMLFARGDWDRFAEGSGFTYTFDGVHLTTSGAKRIADTVIPFLRANGVT